ncbi:MAG: ABC transporter ATP-binding protein [Euryarchaeota archaeon]|nr:ABC transporter ATP-binding protein [Euryarchaeota archaeon]
MMKLKGNTLRIIWFFLSRYKIEFTLLITLAALVGIFETFNVTIMYPILSNSLGSSSTSNPFLNFVDRFLTIIPINDTLVKYCILFVILACFVFIFKLVYFFFSTKITSKIVLDIKQEIFNKCVNSDYQFFIDNKQGEILYQIATAPTFIAQLLNIISSVFVELILSITVFMLLLSMSWKATIIIIIGGIGYYYLTKYLSTRINYQSGMKQFEYSQKETVAISEFTSGIKQIKVFETIPYWKKSFDDIIHAYWYYYRKNVFWGRVPEILLILVLYLSIGGTVIFIKLTSPASFASTIPLIGTFAFAVFLILPKLANFGNYRMQLMNGLPTIESIFNLLKNKKYNKIKNGDKQFTSLKSDLEFRSVTFAHKDRDVLLNNFSLVIQKDKITALVGQSGSGKSTIVNLLLRLYDVNDGGVYLNNTNIKEYDIFSFLDKIGYVSQETFIYNASIKENIAFGDTYTDQEIFEAAKLANADDFIQKLPEKYDTIVGDRGMKVSGGEKQRIAIARAIIRKPEILILDEATSSLDNVSENVVQKAINEVSKNCTTFIIAHRLSTIQNADVIYVMDGGKIIENGTQKQLLSQKGKYWELYNIQQK